MFSLNAILLVSVKVTNYKQLLCGDKVGKYLLNAIIAYTVLSGEEDILLA